jgi:hypothetical protein
MFKHGAAAIQTMTEITEKNAIILAKKVAEFRANESIRFSLTEDGYTQCLVTVITVMDGNIALIGKYGGGSTVSLDIEDFDDQEAANAIEPWIRHYIQTCCSGKIYIDD